MHSTCCFFFGCEPSDRLSYCEVFCVDVLVSLLDLPLLVRIRVRKALTTEIPFENCVIKFLVDSRVWHAVSPNITNADRVAVVIRYAAWWLNLNPTRPSSQEWDPTYEQSRIDDLPIEIFNALPETIHPQVRHLLPPST